MSKKLEQIFTDYSKTTKSKSLSTKSKLDKNKNKNNFKYFVILVLILILIFNNLELCGKYYSLIVKWNELDLEIGIGEIIKIFTKNISFTNFFIILSIYIIL